MVLSALRGAVGFLTRVPVGRDDAAWTAFTRTPVAFPAVGYALGLALTLPFLVPLDPPLAALAFVGWLLVLTGIAHADAVADLGDAVAVHGSPAERVSAMKDTTVGVGAVVAVGLVLLGLWVAGLQLAALPTRALALVVTAEVGATLAMATIACLGTATHEGLGSAVAADLDARSLLLPAAVAAPAALLTWPSPSAAAGLLAAVGSALLLRWWAARRLGGVSGDVIGAGNEIARLSALLAGVIVWTHW